MTNLKSLNLNSGAMLLKCNCLLLFLQSINLLYDSLLLLLSEIVKILLRDMRGYTQEVQNRKYNNNLHTTKNSINP